MREPQIEIGQRRNAAHALAEILRSGRRFQQRLVVALRKEMIEGVDVAHAVSLFSPPDITSSREATAPPSSDDINQSRDRERVGVAVEIADELQAERHAGDLEQRQRQRRHAEQRGRHREIRIAGRGESFRRAAGRGERDAGIASRGELGIEARMRARSFRSARCSAASDPRISARAPCVCGPICRRRGRASSGRTSALPSRCSDATVRRR